jgi:CBS domain-containing protein
MLVKESMTRRAETIGPEEMLQAAARKMRELGIGALPVCEGDRLIGMLTDRDIAVRSTAEGRDPVLATVRSAMTPQVIWCSEDDDLQEAAELMERKAVRRLMVLGPGKRLVGMLSVDDLALVSAALATEVIEHSVVPERSIPGGPGGMADW